MIFERAIDDAATMFLFDKRSQQKLDAMAAEASPRSHDRSLIRLTQAAFAFYNMLEAPKTDAQGSMRGVMTILKEAKLFREDRVFTTLASKLEVDLMLYMSAQGFLEAEKVQKDTPLLREEDSRALAICEALLRNFPATFNPLPTNWYTSLVPLFPTFREPMLNFYAKRGREHRTEPLSRILGLVKREMITAAGIVQAKRFIMERGIRLQNRHALRTLLLGTARDVGMKLESDWPTSLQLVADITPPRGITPSQMDAAVQVVEAQCQQARQEKDLRKFTGSKLQLGILNFMRESPEECVWDLVETLRTSQQISPEDKKNREYRHEEFPDIPFMVGASFLRLNLANRRIQVQDPAMLAKCQTALLRALVLNPQYHQAFVNILLCVSLAHNPPMEEELLRLYLSRFNNDISQLNTTALRNLALVKFQNSQHAYTPDSIRLMLLASFCEGGQLTKAKKMLQELKTLHVLSAHDLAVDYLQTYRNALRMKDVEFIADIEDNALHSALLYYIAYAFTSRALVPGKYDSELNLDHDALDQGIELNAEALYFLAQNSSALRLVETQVQILQYGMQRSERRWDGIANTMGQRFQYYEDHLRLEKSYKMLKERLANLKLEQLVPDMKISPVAASKMEGLITQAQRERLRQRVNAA